MNTDQYLAEMGIDRWVLRDRESAIETELISPDVEEAKFESQSSLDAPSLFETAYRWQKSKQQIVILQSRDHWQQDDQAVNQLLTAMFSALGAELIRAGIPKSTTDVQANCLIILGQKAAQGFFQQAVGLGWQDNLLLANTRVLVISHPAEMLINPVLKRQAWQDLKSLKTND